MNYYAKLVEEKRNSNSFLLGLKNKIFKSTDDLERVLKTFTVDCKVLDEDADGIKVQVLQRDGNHTYKIYLAAYLGGPHEDVIVEKVVKLNSKGEDMNYYAKILEEKKNYNKDKYSKNLSRASTIALTFLKDGASEERIKREMQRDYHFTLEAIEDALLVAKKMLDF